MASVYRGRSYPSDVRSSVHFTHRFGLKELFDAMKINKMTGKRREGWMYGREHNTMAPGHDSADSGSVSWMFYL